MGLLAVDIGNTSTTLGLFDNEGRLAKRFDIPTRTLTHRALTRETLDAPLTGVTPPEVIAIASVVPWASDELIVVLHEIFATATVLVITSTSVPIQSIYPHSDELGTDRLLGALAAYKTWGEREKRPCIVADLGTATTYDCITAEGVFLGGAIAPGLVLGAEALAQRAAQLPEIELSFPASILGRTTVESIQSGILYGGLSQLEGLVKRLGSFAFPNQEPIVVATGGLARLFDGRTNIVTHFDADLVLEGIRLAAELTPMESHLAQQGEVPAMQGAFG
ncbi:MAG TPA: type III pantothenate kinase [Candidatus Kapabacteria bacterium]|nr:type III pantothenate kinase [Candidatus Kapabacteria bacterium]